MYFRLNPECYFIKGKANGAIFDLIEGKMYTLNQQETDLVTTCENDNPIYGDEQFLQELKRRCLGTFYPSKVYVQKLRIGSSIEKQQAGNPPKFYRAFLEINNLCNRDCWFCGYYGIKRSLGCLGCNRWSENGEPLDADKWKEIIDGLNYLGCKNIYITGGDLTLSWDKTIEIIDYANGKFNNIYLTLHEKSVPNVAIGDIIHDVKLIIQTDDVNNVKDDECTYLLTTTPNNWDDFKNISNKNILIDFVIDEGSSLDNYPHIMSKQKIRPRNIHQFLNNLEYHPCLGHTLAICYNGNVLPCPMMRHHSFGNVRSKDIHEIFKNWDDGINKFWTLNLDKIDNCTDCEFRYSCTDCRALEEQLTGKLEGKRLCSYVPKQGIWL